MLQRFAPRLLSILHRRIIEVGRVTKQESFAAEYYVAKQSNRRHDQHGDNKHKLPTVTRIRTLRTKFHRVTNRRATRMGI